MIIICTLQVCNQMRIAINTPCVAKHHLVNLWWPSRCQTKLGHLLWYIFLLMVTLCLSKVPTGSTLWMDTLILDLGTTTLSLVKCPISMHLLSLGWVCLILLTIASRSVSEIFEKVTAGDNPPFSNHLYKVDQLILSISAILVQENISWLSSSMSSIGTMIFGLPRLQKLTYVYSYVLIESLHVYLASPLSWGASFNPLLFSTSMIPSTNAVSSALVMRQPSLSWASKDLAYITCSNTKFYINNLLLRLLHIPYGGKLWRVLTLVNLAKNHLFTNF